ncbi:MAG: hypothetical protein LBC53_10820 [Spirochaetaceae bacterium]|jgi:hypothetical protein|nr:hypothetical protein [Spirochaetaceae bacterium]
MKELYLNVALTAEPYSLNAPPDGSRPKTAGKPTKAALRAAKKEEKEQIKQKKFAALPLSKRRKIVAKKNKKKEKREKKEAALQEKKKLKAEKKREAALKRAEKKLQKYIKVQLAVEKKCVKIKEKAKIYSSKKNASAAEKNKKIMEAVKAKTSLIFKDASAKLKTADESRRAKIIQKANGRVLKISDAAAKKCEKIQRRAEGKGWKKNHAARLKTRNMTRAAKNAVEQAKRYAEENGRTSGFSVKDFFITVICLSGAIFSLLFFLYDLNATLIKSNEKSIGTVDSKYKITQRKFSDRQIWDTLKQDSLIYSGDLIHTSSLSNASIGFQKGGSLNLDENTLVQIFDGANGTLIELSSGKVDVVTTEATAYLDLAAAGTVVRILPGSKVTANALANGNTAIQVATGKAELTKNGATEEVGTGAVLAVSKSGLADIPLISLIAPASNNQYTASSPDPIPIIFIWATQNYNPDGLVHFEVAKDSGFTKIAATADLRSTTTRIERLEPGTYWWRVYPAEEDEKTETKAPSAKKSFQRAYKVNANQKKSEITSMIFHKFSIVLAIKPTLLSPKDGVVINYHARLPQVNFRWRASNSDASGRQPSWRITVSSDQNFTNNRINQIVRDVSFSTASLEAGRWYWRVEEENGAGGPSETGVFSIEQSNSQLRPVDLSMPVSGAFINIAYDAPSSNFIWRDELEAVSYQVTVSKEPDFSNILFSREVTESRFLYSPKSGAIPPGSYYWRVSWKDANGDESPVSQMRQFNAIEGDIVFENISPSENWTAISGSLAENRFSWRTNLGGAGRVQISRTPDFSQVISELPADGGGVTAFGVTRIEGASGLRLSIGDYYWRVLAAGTGGSADLYTTPRHFEIRNAVRVDLRSPADSAVIDGLQALRNPPKLTWGASGATYKSALILSKNPDPAQGEAILYVSNPGRSVSLPNNLTTGVYYWTVIAETERGVDISAAAPFSFTVTPMPRLPAPQIIAPANGAVITPDILRSNRQINFSWSSSRGANAYILTIYNQSDASRQNPIFTSPILRNNSYQFNSLSLLDAGAFVWQVEPIALTPEDKFEQRGQSSVSRFSININLPQSQKMPDEEVYGM